MQGNAARQNEIRIDAAILTITLMFCTDTVTTEHVSRNAASFARNTSQCCSDAPSLWTKRYIIELLPSFWTVSTCSLHTCLRATLLAGPKPKTQPWFAASQTRDVPLAGPSVASARQPRDVPVAGSSVPSAHGSASAADSTPPSESCSACCDCAWARGQPPPPAPLPPLPSCLQEQREALPPQQDILYLPSHTMPLTP